MQWTDVRDGRLAGTTRERPVADARAAAAEFPGGSAVSIGRSVRHVKKSFGRWLSALRRDRWPLGGTRRGLRGREEGQYQVKRTLPELKGIDDRGERSARVASIAIPVRMRVRLRETRD